jgi:hypothetical protein
MLSDLVGVCDLFVPLGQGSKINQQFLSFNKQKQRLAKQHEVWMVDLITLDHFAPFVRPSLSIFCRVGTESTASPRNRRGR